MKLTDLEPEFLFGVSDHHFRRAGDRRHAVAHAVFEDTPLEEIFAGEAQGVLFYCPGCFAKNEGPVGTERVLCWFKDKGVPPDELPGPGRWQVSGTGFDDLSLSPSINVDHGHWHGWVRNGEVTP